DRSRLVLREEPQLGLLELVVDEVTLPDNDRLDAADLLDEICDGEDDAMGGLLAINDAAAFERVLGSRLEREVLVVDIDRRVVEVLGRELVCARRGFGAGLRTRVFRTTRGETGEQRRADRERLPSLQPPAVRSDHRASTHAGAGRAARVPARSLRLFPNRK